MILDTIYIYIYILYEHKRIYRFRVCNTCEDDKHIHTK
jgi:hypothetical protein